MNMSSHSNVAEKSKEGEINEGFVLLESEEIERCLAANYMCFLVKSYQILLFLGNVVPWIPLSLALFGCLLLFPPIDHLPCWPEIEFIQLENRQVAIRIKVRNKVLILTWSYCTIYRYYTFRTGYARTIYLSIGFLRCHLHRSYLRFLSRNGRQGNEYLE